MERSQRPRRAPPALEEVLRELPPEVARWFRAHPKFPHNPRYLIDVVLTALGYVPQHDPNQPEGQTNPNVAMDAERAQAMTCPWCHKAGLDFVPYFRADPWHYRAFAYCRRRGCSYAFGLRTTDRPVYQSAPSAHPSSASSEAGPTDADRLLSLFEALPS